MSLLKNKSALHYIFILIILLFLSWQCFFAMDYVNYQWWEFAGSDYETTAVTTPVAIINDGKPIDHLFYPAVTMYNIYGLVLRIVATTNNHYAEILHFKDISNFKEVHTILNKAVHITRLCVPFIMFLIILKILNGFVMKLTP